MVVEKIQPPQTLHKITSKTQSNQIEEPIKTIPINQVNSPPKTATPGVKQKSIFKTKQNQLVTSEMTTKTATTSSISIIPKINS